MKIEIGRGLECIVYNVGNGRCYKEYKISSYVDVIYENAKLAFEAGIAPEVYERDENGYYTEIVDVETFDNFMGVGSAIRNGIIDEEEYNDLTKKLYDVLGCYKDLHLGNLGLKNGKLVAIDFGIISTG